MDKHARLMVVTAHLKEEAEKDISPAMLEKLKELVTEAQTLLTSLTSTPPPSQETIA